MCRQLIAVTSAATWFVWLCLSTHANGQPVGQTEPTLDQVIAGVREYPASVLRSLLVLGEQPLLLRQLAEEPQGLAEPDKIYPPIPAELKAALPPLRQVPEAVAVAASFPDELARLRQFSIQSPELLEKRIAELRQAYEAARVSAACAWESALRQDSALLDAYARLVTQFCRQQRAESPDFPCVEVRSRQYYYACPPDELLKAYIEDSAAPATLKAVVQQWWNRFSPVQIDRLVLDGARVAVAGPSDCVARLTPEARADMWRPVRGDGEGCELVPIILQPLADQLDEAILAYAVAEHVRLWGEAAGVPDAGEEWEPEEHAALPDGRAPRGIIGSDVSTWSEPVPWTDVLPVEQEGTEGVIVRRHTTYVYDEPFEVAEPAVDFDVNLYCGAARRYYVLYPWTLPILYVWRPYPLAVACGSRLNCGRHLELAYGQRVARVSLRIGGRPLRYYCRLPRHLHLAQQLGRSWRNYGAPYGGPYWVNYGHSYPGHPGLADCRVGGHSEPGRWAIDGGRQERDPRRARGVPPDGRFGRAEERDGRFGPAQRRSVSGTDLRGDRRASDRGGGIQRERFRDREGNREMLSRVIGFVPPVRESGRRPGWSVVVPQRILPTRPEAQTTTERSVRRQAGRELAGGATPEVRRDSNRGSQADGRAPVIRPNAASGRQVRQGDVVTVISSGAGRPSRGQPMPSRSEVRPRTNRDGRAGLQQRATAGERGRRP